MSSRSSSASAASSAASSGSSRIDLGKDESVDLGGKTQPSASSDGIGITQEVATIGGLQIEGGVSIDVSPLELEVSSNGKDKISIAGSAEIPGGLLGIGGGVVIDTGTGQIKGGSISGEVGGFGVEISKSEEGFGLGLSYQIPGTPIVITIGFGEAKKEPTPTQEPTPTPSNEPDTSITRSPAPSFPVGKRVNLFYEAKGSFYSDTGRPYQVIDRLELRGGGTVTASAYSVLNPGNVYYSTNFQSASKPFPPGFDVNNINRISVVSDSWHYYPEGSLWNRLYNVGQIVQIYARWKLSNGTWSAWIKSVREEYYIEKSTEPILAPALPSPNPPPRKEMDECCRESMRMLRRLSTVMQVDNVLKGKVQIPGELIAIPEEGKTLPPEILQTYPQMVNAILLAVNRHGMDAPIIVEIEDTDKTTAGDQSAVHTYDSPSVAMQAALEMLHELKAAGNARLSIQIGIAFAVTRILKIVAGASESIREIIKMLGMPFRHKPKKMLLEFNLAGIKKGYGKDSKPKEFSEMSKEELEKIVPTLLEGSECDIPVPAFTSSEADNIRQMLCKLTIRTNN